MPNAPPRVVAFGGGSGMSTILRGLKEFTADLLAVVTVGDDGGSSGRLRRQHGIIPPGDLRNCLVALADDRSILPRLFSHRFAGKELAGHSFGNLLLTALIEVCGGDILAAMEEASRILQVRGRVLPANLAKVTLVAEHPDGSKTTGESAIGKAGKRIRRIELRPDAGRAPAEALAALARADLVIFGPGSLYTSIIPALLAGGVVEAIRASAARRVYLANLMTQPGETDGYTVFDHVLAIEAHTFSGFVEVTLANRRRVEKSVSGRYAAQGSTEVLASDEVSLARHGVRLYTADLAAPGDLVRHNPVETARIIVERIWPASRSPVRG
ncbi:MAG: YvcK family protein [Planctomycetes bacterium]|nr:YvcK family protein [Planctomycetota bacterium]